MSKVMTEEIALGTITNKLGIDPKLLQERINAVSADAVVEAIRDVIRSAMLVLDDDSLEVMTLREIASNEHLRLPGVPLTTDERTCDYHIHIAKHALAERAKKQS